MLADIFIEVRPAGFNIGAESISMSHLRCKGTNREGFDMIVKI